MKDPLLKYIDENKNQLDSYTPAEKNWQAIQHKKQKSKKIKKAVVYAASLAAVLLVAISIINYNAIEEKTELTQIETNSDFESFWDSTFINRTEDVNWTNNRQFEYQIPAEHEGFRVVETYLNRSGLTFEYSADSYTSNGYYTVTVKDVQASSGTYNPVSPTQSQSFSCYSWDSEDIIDQPVQHEVDRYYEQYDPFKENQFETPLEKPLSTFGIDVDGAGYSNMRRFIQSGYLPPKDAVKLEEMVNYFNYDLPEPTGDHPFSITTEVGECPWEKDNLLMQVALKGERIKMAEKQANNLVFLIDVSGSMAANDKLPLLKKSMNLLVNEMGVEDKIAIVVYAGAAGLVLAPTSGKNKSTIYDAIENLSSGGSTAGGEGIELAYKVANEARFKNGNNRVILATDGDFNIGITGDDALVQLIEKKRETGINLSVLGFGTGNLQSSKMEKLADNGNGNYNYIDNILEAKKVLVNEMGGTLVTIAKDVKLQVEFNPEYVKSYRLLGYENRILATKDFDDDTKDAGDLGSGHTVVALYEIIPVEDRQVQKATNLRYQKNTVNTSKGLKDELALIKFRYKKPNGTKSKRILNVVNFDLTTTTSNNFKFASAVAEFGLLIRNSKHKGNASFEAVLARAKISKGMDKYGYRAEFIQLVKKARLLMKEYQTKH